MMSFKMTYEILRNLHYIAVKLQCMWCYPDSKVYGANMGPIWGRQDPAGRHVGPINLDIWVGKEDFKSELPHHRGQEYLCRNWCEKHRCHWLPGWIIYGFQALLAWTWVVITVNVFGTGYSTYCGWAMPYCNIELGQHSQRPMNQLNSPIDPYTVHPQG